MTAVVLVTHNSERWIEATLRSMLAQTQAPDEIVIVDDNSTDRTRDIITDLLGSDVEIQRSLSKAANTSTRIAQNFVQGVRATHADVVILADHDDVWLPSRIAHQSAVMDANPEAAMVASSAQLINHEGELLTGTLRATFPVPTTFNTWARSLQVTYAITHSVATGGVSAIRPKRYDRLEVPSGWLHDRWWSLVAVSQGAFVLDDGVVAQYRISDTQEVGLATNNQGSPQWLAHQIAKGPTVAKRVYQVAGLLWRQRNQQSG
jgi:glycosyltransferase involved in cell wall biosynthesis